VASLRASLDDRLHEQSILRALGGQAATLKRIAMVELGFSGLVAGLVGCGSGALFVFLLGRQVFELPMALGLGTAVWVLVLSVAAVIAVGLAILNRVYAVSPLVIWRKS
jgi:putative ABC transport system permease protein